MDKRFSTVELPKPTQWGIWYDGAYLSTYQVCILLNEYVDVKNENEQLKTLLRAYQKSVEDYKYQIRKAIDEKLSIIELADNCGVDVE